MLRYLLILTMTVLLALALASCGGSASTAGVVPDATIAGGSQSGGAPQTNWPADLPQDAPQPWEQLDAQGHVVPASGRGVSAINADSQFVPGVERYSDGGTAADNGEATSLASAAGAVSSAIYRIPLGSDEPGVISVDANTTAGNGYYVGLADYAANAWQWHGPFTDNHVRFDTASGSSGADYTSPLGNVFVCVVAYDGASCDVVGIGVNPSDSADTTPPPAPGTPTITPVDGGLFLEWLPVAAGDLAGYRIYHANHWFFDGAGAGVVVDDSLEGLTSHVLGGLTGKTFVRISAVDITGNESPLSDIISAEPLANAPEPLTVAVSAPSGALNDTITITASGAESYDFDTDGDGVYDITGDDSGTASIDTTSLGIIRAGVRGSSGGVSFAQGGVSVIIAGNSRPVANASASPTSGDAPLDVTFDGSGSMDFDGSIFGGGWDFDGDGTYDVWSDSDTSFVTSSDYTYSTPGVYNAKLRVVDDKGAWDVDTVAILVSAQDVPQAMLTATPGECNKGGTVRFDTSPSFETESYDDIEWDLDNNGVFNEAGDEADNRGNVAVEQTYPDAGVKTVSARVTFSGSGTSIATAQATVHGWSITDIATFAVPGDLDFPINSDLLVVNGKPAVVYRNPDDNSLYYIASTDAYGTSWNGDPTTVIDYNTDGIAYEYSAAVVDGRPAVACALNSNSLAYSIATTAGGDTWDSPVTVESANDGSPVMLVVDGNPAIAFHNSPDSDVKFCRASAADGSTWEDPVLVDDNGQGDTDLSMALVDGFPAISRRFWNGNVNVRYYRADDADGSSWGPPQDLNPPGFTSDYTALAVVNGFPAVTYQDIGNSLMFIRAMDATGSSWGSAQTVNDTTTFAVSNQLATIDGKPVISTIGGNPGPAVVEYYEALDGNGTSWAPAVDVASGSRVSFAVLHGLPAMCITDWQPYVVHKLKFAIRY